MLRGRLLAVGSLLADWPLVACVCYWSIQLLSAPGSRLEREMTRTSRFGKFPRGTVVALVAATLFACGCAQRQYSHLLAGDDQDLVGSHTAGAATWNPLVDEAVAKLLGHCPPVIQPVGFAEIDGLAIPGEDAILPPPRQAAVCFVGLENKSAEELLDFKDQLFERIDTQINSAGSFRSISRRMVEAALRETRLRPDSLFLPANSALFAAALGRQGAPVDYLLFGTITSGTTDRNKSTQRDYLLTLEMVNLKTGDYIKESAKIRKGYHKNRTGKWWNYGPFDQADG